MIKETDMVSSVKVTKISAFLMASTDMAAAGSNILSEVLELVATTPPSPSQSKNKNKTDA